MCAAAAARFVALLLRKFATKVLVPKCLLTTVTGTSKVAAAANDFVTFVFTVYTYIHMYKF